MVNRWKEMVSARRPNALCDVYFTHQEVKRLGQRVGEIKELYGD
jgi:nitrate reductase assembly molybdenum cofactor insertion protein NarJ